MTDTFRPPRLPLVMALLTVMALYAAPARAQEDRHAGYYYPEPSSSEVYRARIEGRPQVSRIARVAFITALTQQMAAAPGGLRVAVFAKGGEADKLIIVSLGAGQFDTLYRLRALLAVLTAWARTTPALAQTNAAEDLTFLDLAALLGFTRVTVSDGDRLAHQIDLE